MKILLASLLLGGAASMAISAEILKRSPVEAITVVSLPITGGFVSRQGRAIDTIVLHSSYNSLGGDVYSVEKLINIYRYYGVSSHYLIDRQGRVYRLVRDQDMSFHAGVSRMPDGRTGVNRFSLGIELMNTREDHYTEAQYRSLQGLMQILRKQYPIKYVVGHGQIAPTRRSDPWNFGWHRLDRDI